MRRNISIILAFLFGINLCFSQDIISLGKGSYSQTPPAYSAGRYNLFPWPDTKGLGNKAYSMVNDREIFVVEDNEKPIPTNDWLTSLFKNQFSGELWAYPLLIDAESYGLHIEYPHTWSSNGRHMESHSELEIKAEGFTALAALPQNWSDWTMEFLMPGTNDGNMMVTLGHGLPYVWVETEGLDPYIEADIDAFFNIHGEVLTLPAISDNVGIEINGDFYGLFAPSGTHFEVDQNKLSINLPQENSYLIVAALPAKSLFSEYYKYAYAVPRDTRVDYKYIEEDGKLYTSWNIDAENLKGESNVDVIQGFIPHHYRTTDMGFNFNEDMNYSTPRGTMKSAIGRSFSIAYKFNGLLPSFPKPNDYNLDNPFDSNLVKLGIEDFTANRTFGSDTYWGGKDLVMKAQYALMAQNMGMDSASIKIQDNLISALSDWYTFDKGESEYCFTYYPNWGAMVGFNTSYFSDEFTDHHFHYGYFSFATGLLGLVNQDFIDDYGPMAKLIAADYANWKREDKMLPYFRTFDIWAGHSYAGGLVDGGNGQESSSEAMQSWGGLFMLAMATRDTEMRDAAIFGYVSEAQGTAEYWFDRYKVNPEDEFPARNNIPESYDKPYNTNLESGGIGYWNWFSGNMGFNHAIQWIPWSPLMKYFNEDPEFAQYEHDFVLENWVNNEDGWSTTTDYYNGWAGMASIDILSVADPDAAAAKLEECRDNGQSVGIDALRHYNVHSPRTYGTVVWDRYIDYPLTTIYYNEKTQLYTYVVFNAENSEKTFNVYDYHSGLVTSFKAPARKLTAYQGNPILTSIEVSSNAVTVPVGDSIQFMALAYDQYGATVESELDWSISGGGLISTDGLFVASANGEYTLTVSSGTVQKVIDLRVGEAPVVSSISINAKNLVVEQEDEMLFSADVLDQYGDIFEDTRKWSVSGGGTIDDNGLFKANTEVGTFVLSVECGGEKDSVDITVRMPLVNVAIGKDAYASSDENIEYPPEDAVDGVVSYQSRWSSSFNDNQYWALDLGSSYDIDYINIVWQNSCAEVYEIYFANEQVDVNNLENHAWGSPIYSTTNGGPGTITIDISKELQYFYIKCIDRINQYGFSIMEFEAYGLPVNTADAQLTSIIISPSYPEISDLDSIQLSATGYDQYGQVVDISPQWTMLDDTQGTISSDGWYKPAEWARGLINVNARANNIIGFGPVIVQPSYSKVADIVIQPESDTSARVNVAEGVPYKFSALVKNQFYWDIEGEVEWSTSGGGTIQQNGYFTATNPGDYQIYATCQGIQDTAFISVTQISGVNIALNKPTKSSSVETINMPERAVDGLEGTRWASGWLPEATWEVNLEATYNLSSIEIDWQNAHAEQYSIEVSVDGEFWNTAFVQSDGKGGTEAIDMAGNTAKYIRIVCTDRYMEMYGYSFFEFRVYASGMSVTPELSEIKIIPGRIWLSAGGELTYEAVGYDQFGDEYALDTLEWSVSGAGEINSEGVFSSEKPGNYFVIAKSGNVTASSKVTILEEPVIEVDQKPFCAILSPTSGRVIVNEETIIEASAFDYDGVIKKVEFFIDEQKIGEDSVEPYSISWTPEEVKEYGIYVIAYDSLQSTQSSMLSIRSVDNISNPTLVISSPAEEYLWVGELTEIRVEALYFDTDISHIEFFVNGTKLGQDNDYPYTLDWTPTSEEIYKIYAKTTDTEGNIYHTDTVAVLARSNTAPSIEISFDSDTVLVNNMYSIQALAFDNESNISKVEFYIDGVKIGEALEVPYVLDWSPTISAEYILHAIIYDELGLESTSEYKSVIAIDELSGEELLKNNFRSDLFPNPARNTINIELAENFSHYEICNASGSVLRSGKVDASRLLKLSIDDLNNGVYFIRLFSNESVAAYRFVKN